MDLINTTFRINVPLSEADIEVLSHPLGDIIWMVVDMMHIHPVDLGLV